jgi:hypothetical protein
MTPHTVDELNEMFAAHEPLAPDADAVLIKSQQIAARMRRRQWVLRTTGTVAVTAGVVAGAVAVPGLLGSSSHESAVVQPAAGGPAGHTQDEELAAYFAAGYGYADAERLARLWQIADPTAAKAEAGGRLLDGETLPFKPSGPDAQGISTITAADRKNAALAQSFYDEGYTYEDAVALAKLWHSDDAYQAKVDAGRRLQHGKTLPIEPGSTPASAEARALNAYWAAGYDADDAVELGKLWHETDTSQVKVEAGKMLERGETLPIAP